MTPAARLAAAIELLGGIESDRRPADAVANEFFRNRRFIGGADRRDVSVMVWAVLRERMRLGWWLTHYGAEQTPRLIIAVASLLRGNSLGKVEALFANGRYAAGALSEAEKTLLERMAGHTLEHPNMPEHVKLEIPDFVLPLLRAKFGNGLEAELAAMSTQAPLDLRVNLLKGSRADAIAALRREGVAAVPTPFSPWGLRIEARQSVTAGAAFREGLIEIQDEGSQLVAMVVDAQPGQRVADYCAGAAGKTLAIAMTMENKGHIFACDVSTPRLDAAIKRLRRAGVHNAERHLLEPGDKWAKRQAGSFDRVLIDAPCTGTGTWRRNPDGRLRLRPIDLAEIAPKQAMILDTAQKLLRIGGRLVYATCSILDEENEAQMSGFLQRHPGFRRVDIAGSLPAALHGPALSLTPLRHNTDGFFAACLERVA
ncbi:MAG: rRNA cytosine-C5-methylase [Rhodospirillales bacterium 20-60-12]|nr:MAG: rRNA cytosine-C5-methylase [Rhodospirillales bacterium 20-60-12]HQT67154.1 RsmB/NOP family class I SAM-dependent RNA methyltransferase [Acetobacteraceae bacterium]HQU00843.1 RsmB/NOP family class I SAM-dependent RNA methyltransferase [Acetobacteraceae bacterium]